MKKLLLSALLSVTMFQANAQVNQYVVKQNNNPIVSNYVVTKETLKPQQTDKTVFTLETNTKAVPPSTTYNITESLKNKNPQMKSYKLDPKELPVLKQDKNSSSLLVKKENTKNIPKKAKIKPVEEPGLLPQTK